MTRQKGVRDLAPGPRAADGFVRSAETGLLLPDRLATPHRLSGAEWFRIRGTWQDVYGQKPTWQDVADRLSRFGLGQVLVVLGGVSAILNSYEPLKSQPRIVQALFQDPQRVGRAFQDYWERLKLEGVVDLPLFFTEPQVVAIAKIALLVCPHVTERSSRSLQPVGEALIMAADLIDREEAVGLTTDVRSSRGADAWLRFVVMNGVFNASDNFKHALVRSHDLYIPDGLPVDPDHTAIDLRQRFEEITGLDPDFAWAMGMALFANWRTVDRKSDRPPGPLSLKTYTSALNLAETEIGGIQKLFAVDSGEARKTLRDRGCGPRALLPYDINPLDRWPLVSLEGRLYCPSVQLLRWKLTAGLHHVFLRRTEGNDKAKRDGYLTYAGRVFGDYVEALFRRVFPTSAGRFVDDRTLRRMIPAKLKACDGVILYGDTVLLLEYKATLLPYGVRAKGDIGGLRSKVAKIFGTAAKQFDNTIQAIEDGCLGSLVQPSNVTRYLPLVVTLDMLPVEGFLYQAIERAIATSNALTHGKAQPLQVLAVSELELLEDYMADGGSLAALLLKRIENDTYRDSPLKNHLLAQGYHRVLRSNRWLQRRYEAISERTMNLLRAKAGGPW